MPDEEKGFKVVDKRSFDADGADKAPADESAPEHKASDSAKQSSTCAEPHDFAGVGDGPMPEFDFVTFILSLHRSAACHLGHAPDPETQTCEQNLPLAKQTIDIISMLQKKTQGNLTGEEERILSEILYDLRMAFVQASAK